MHPPLFARPLSALAAVALLTSLGPAARAQDINSIQGSAPKPAPAIRVHTGSARTREARRHVHTAHTRVVHRIVTEPAAVRTAPAGLSQDCLAAAEEGDLDRYQHFLSIGVSRDATQADGTTALMLAAQNDRMNIVRYLVEQQNVPLETRNHDRRTALSLAAFAGNNDAVDYLIAHGAVANASDAGGNTPLMLAVERDHPDTVTTLLKDGANVNIGDSFENTPLIQASKQGEMDIVTVLLAARPKARLHKRNLAGQTALAAAQAGNHTDVVQALQAAGASE
jgi:ankyrin repeat protein